MKQLSYCDKKTGSMSKCGCIAEYISKFITKTNKENGHVAYHNRCEKHKTTSTANKTCIETKPLDQQKLIIDIKTKLNTYIGKDIYSSRERSKYPIKGKYVKECGIMCQNNFNNKWVYVYYHQIIGFNI